MYFTEETEAAIVAYNSTNSHREKNAIYNEHLRKPFEKLVENIIHTFKFYYFDIPIESVKHEVISFMITRLDKYKQGKGKAFSYFSVVVKNWLICHNNNNYKKMKTHNDVLDLKHKDVKNTSYDDNTVRSQEEKEFFNSVIEYWEENIDKVFKKERDVRIAYSIIELYVSLIVSVTSPFGCLALLFIYCNSFSFKSTSITSCVFQDNKNERADAHPYD